MLLVLQQRVFFERFCYDIYLQKYIVAKSKYLVLNAPVVSCKATYLFCFLLCPKAIIILQAN